jgi:hypothetical protein
VQCLHKDDPKRGTHGHHHNDQQRSLRERHIGSDYLREYTEVEKASLRIQQVVDEALSIGAATRRYR